MQKRKGRRNSQLSLVSGGALAALSLSLIVPMGATAAPLENGSLTVKSYHVDGFEGQAGMMVPNGDGAAVPSPNPTPDPTTAPPAEEITIKFYFMRVGGLIPNSSYELRSYDKNGTLMSTSGVGKEANITGDASYSFLRTRNKTADVLPVSLEVDNGGKTYRITYTESGPKGNEVLSLKSRIENGVLTQVF